MTIKLSTFVSVAALTMALATASPALAQGTADERSACMGDAFRFCSADIPDVTKIEACLKQNRAQLQPACQAEFEPAGKTRIRAGHFR